MAYKAKTLRNMTPEARKVARLINELDSTTRRLKNLIPRLQSIEIDSRALFAMNKKDAKPETVKTGIDDWEYFHEGKPLPKPKRKKKGGLK